MKGSDKCFEVITSAENMMGSIIEKLLLEVVVLRLCVKGKQIVVQQNHLLQFLFSCEKCKRTKVFCVFNFFLSQC